MTHAASIATFGSIAERMWGDVIVFAWIGQVLLFFVFWKLLHWGAIGVRSRMTSWSFLWELVVNLILSIVLLIVFSQVSSVWWLMIVAGAVIGIITGLMASRST